MSEGAPRALGGAPGALTRHPQMDTRDKPTSDKSMSRSVG
jgi:hypothetical protein